jgi:hypothetical protein
MGVSVNLKWPHYSRLIRPCGSIVWSLVVFFNSSQHPLSCLHLSVCVRYTVPDCLQIRSHSLIWSCSLQKFTNYGLEHWGSDKKASLASHHALIHHRLSVALRRVWRTHGASCLSGSPSCTATCPSACWSSEPLRLQMTTSLSCSRD